VKASVKRSVKTSVKTSVKILELVELNNVITITEIAAKIGISERFADQESGPTTNRNAFMEMFAAVAQ